MGAITKDLDRWAGGIVPYEIDPDSGNTGTIYAVMAAIEARTGVRFVRRSFQTLFVRIIRKTAGNQRTDGSGSGSPRILAISEDDPATIYHEMLHVLGMEHEHQRSDRDRFVRIVWDNIPDGQDQYEMLETEHTPDYDYFSIMHYHTGSPDRPQIVPLDPLIDPTTIGHATEPTALDYWMLNKVYPGGPAVVRRSSGAPADRAVTEVAVASRPHPTAADYSYVYTAIVRDIGTLALIRWRVGPEGSVRYGTDTGHTHGNASQVDIAFVGEQLIGAMRNANGALYLIWWDADLHVRRTAEAGFAMHPKVVPLGTGLFLTACVNGSGRLLLIAWRMENDQLVRIADSGDHGPPASTLAACKVGLENGQYVVATAAGRVNGSTRVDTWRVAQDGSTISAVANTGNTIGEATRLQCVVSLGQLFLTCLDASSKVLLIPIYLRANGDGVRRGDRDHEGHGPVTPVLHVVPRDYGLLTAVLDSGGHARLIRWSTTDARVHELSNSGGQSEPVRTVCLTSIPNTPLASVCSVATNMDGKPFLVVCDDMGGSGELHR